MIVNAILDIITTVLDSLLTILYSGVADVVVETNFLTALTSANNWFQGVNNFFPVSNLVLALFGFLVVETTLFVYKGVRWMYRKIPGIS